MSDKEAKEKKQFELKKDHKILIGLILLFVMYFAFSELYIFGNMRLWTCHHYQLVCTNLGGWNDIVIDDEYLLEGRKI